MRAGMARNSRGTNLGKRKRRLKRLAASARSRSAHLSFLRRGKPNRWSASDQPVIDPKQRHSGSFQGLEKRLGNMRFAAM